MSGADGSLYIADTGNGLIRRVTPNGIITTVAGNGTSGAFSGDGGPATAARLNSPGDVALGPDGSLYIADTYHLRIRRVGPDGTINTFAGNGRRGTKATAVRRRRRDSTTRVRSPSVPMAPSTSPTSRTIASGA
ncbi:MAG: hypothetical protein IPG84_05545 [Betaproteobacteria bacterium]|nr:hypothetical protein [Betaproteobacteria bacterium]